MHHSRFILIAIIFLMLYSCNINNETKVDIIDTIKKETIKPEKVNVDTLVVDKNCAVFFMQDSLEIEKRKKIGKNTDNFYTAADDELYYLSIARTFIDSVKIPRIENFNNKFIKFITTKNKTFIYKVSSLQYLCGIYFFDTNKEPKNINIIDVEQEYKDYFLIK